MTSDEIKALADRLGEDWDSATDEDIDHVGDLLRRLANVREWAGDDRVWGLEDGPKAKVIALIDGGGR